MSAVNLCNMHVLKQSSLVTFDRTGIPIMKVKALTFIQRTSGYFLDNSYIISIIFISIGI
jgi:hypothetical protein